MKRWIISKIEYVPDVDLGGFYRMALQKYPDLNYEFGEIPVDPTTGIPTKSHGFALVSSRNVARFRNDADVDMLPDFPLDAKVSAMANPKRTEMKATLTKYGIPTSVVDTADGYRDVIRAVGRTIKPDFVEDSFDVTEI